MFEIFVFFVATAAAAIASISGFGIGSLLTPAVSIQLGTKLAVALVSIPHLIATALRYWILRKKVNRQVLLTFGIASAVGGLLGAILHIWIQSAWLTIIFGILLLTTSSASFFKLNEKIHLKRVPAMMAGVLSGVFGGLVGNQGGIRASALMTFRISKEAFVATSTATGLIVDGARMPIYFWFEGADLLSHLSLTFIMIAGVITGTILGVKILNKIPEPKFRTFVSLLIGALGILMVAQGLSSF